MDPDFYELVGDTVIANAHLVLAVWDGGPSGGHGGTTELVQDAAHAGLPIIHVDAAGREPTRIVWAGFGPLRWAGIGISELPCGPADGVAKVVEQLLQPPGFGH